MGDTDIQTTDDPGGRWAGEVVRSLQLARTISTVLVVLAGVALALGLAASVLNAWTWVSDRGVDGFTQSTGWQIVFAQSASALLASMLPTGVLLAAAAFLRMYAIRYETELLEDEDDLGPEVGEAAVDAG